MTNFQDTFETREQSFISGFSICMTVSFKSFLVYYQILCFFTKAEISFLLGKSACAHLAANFSAVNLLNSCVMIYLSL